MILLPEKTNENRQFVLMIILLSVYIRETLSCSEELTLSPNRLNLQCGTRDNDIRLQMSSLRAASCRSRLHAVTLHIFYKGVYVFVF